MKTTVEIAGPLLEEARAEARRRGSTLRALIELGLRHVLDDVSDEPYVVPDRAVTGRGPSRWEQLGPDERLAMIHRNLG